VIIMTLAIPYRDVINHVNQNVIGQPAAIDQLARALKITAAGLRDPGRPLAVLMVAGPTGTGKSEAMRALAEAIHNDPDKLCRVDCNLLAQSHTAASLSGSPPGYVGSVESSTLLDKKLIEGKLGRPGLLVLEEIEKAHPDVFDVLLGIFDKGVLNMNNGKSQINFSNTIIVMTSNAGARALSDVASGKQMGFAPTSATQIVLSDDDRKQIVTRELKELFRPEFLNRLDDVVVFRWLERPDLELIVNKFLDQLGGRLAQFPHFLKVSKAAQAFLVANGTDIANGARPLKRAIRRYLEEPLAEMLVDGLPYEHVRFHVTHKHGEDKLSIACGFAYVAAAPLGELTMMHSEPVEAEPEPELEPDGELQEDPDCLPDDESDDWSI
jgi:ATP-dependent Clp protease ATP-binding subunit ClpA